MRADTWTGDDATDAHAHQMYVSGGRWGFFWYDGSYAGRPKPIAHATRFLRRYIDGAYNGAGPPRAGEPPFWTDNARFRLRRAAAPVPRRTDGSSSGMGGSYEFTGPDCLFVGGVRRYVSQRLNFTVDRRGFALAHDDVVPVASVFLAWSSGGGGNVTAAAGAEPARAMMHLMATNDVKVDVRTGSFARPGGQPGALWPVTSLQLLEGEVQTLVLNV